MSARGSYEAPVFRVREHNQPGSERRSTHPINQLGRALDQLCLEASDPFEIAAHLEALGYNNTNVAARYGVADHFELAQELFYLTPRRLGITLPSPEVRRSYARQLIMVLTLLVTAGIGLLAEVGAWGPVVWLLVWSQLGGALLNRARGELAEPQQQRVLSLLLELGLLGLVLVWFVTPFALATWAVSLLWLGVAGLLWAERLRAGYLLPCIAGVFLALTVGLKLPPTVMLAACGVTTLVLLRPLLVWSTPASWRWSVGQWRRVLPFILYGLGQGGLLLALLFGAGTEALPGLVLFALVLLIAESQLLRLRGRLNLYLWKGESAAHYTHFARRTILHYTAVYLLPFLPALIVFLFPNLVGQRWLFHLAGFALFGLVLALGLAALSLGDSMVPAVVFAVGGALVMLGLPFFWVAGTMALLEFIALLRRSARLGSYGVYLL